MGGPERTVDPQTDTALGVALVGGSAVAYSSAGFFTRLIDVDLWTLIFWRGIFSTIFLVAAARAQHRQTIALFRERSTKVTPASASALQSSVVLTFGGSHFAQDIGGDLLALATTVLMALMIISISSIVAAALARPAEPSALQLAELALFGITQLGLGLLLLRPVPAASPPRASR